ncbi:Nuclear GTPase SLIP-GC 4 [Colletotrichum chlorophyti]|uniref:Nuclear GTPase SLIP-GC 4 n=1 Tax=Colletotrichum chlorophyti TaxID=708187 RepID=A0A1Q8RC65_9PEZI|nr:Nuclear GTPase SLIP-GC 4 [Colletotrichum chlorophyti]
MEGQSVLEEGSVSEMAHRQLDLAKSEKNASQLRVIDAKTTELLGDIKLALASVSDLRRARQWCENIEKLQGNCKMPRFIIGVLGDTGSGKSSAINAVLDEERVVPTNCMRACTAVITEISWNTSDDPTKKYRAEVEFITQAEWTTEVIALHRDILDHNGNLSPDIRNADSDAGTAYAVLKSVYPTHTDEQLKTVDPAVLANFSRVREVIGKTRIVEEAECHTFYSKIQAFVDSEEKRLHVGLDTSNLESREPTMAFWPLIKVVRVYLKSEVVSTGVVLVDLPGGRDSNATRAAVAAKYVKECSRLWVVAPITRAVDDKTAKTLMGDHFKQQLKYDGTYANITFICTKADDIGLDEAASSLGLEGFIAKEEQRRTAIKSNSDVKKKELVNLEAEKSAVQERYTNVAKDLDTWQGLHRQVIKGQKTFPPMESPRKRKRLRPDSPKNSPVSKKMKKEPGLSDTDDSSDDDSDVVDEQLADDNQEEPLTAEEARKNVDELKAMKRSVREEKREITKKIAQLKTDIKDLNIQHKNIKTSMYQKCVQGRNLYSREAIKEDFAFGLKELDEELLADQQHDPQEQSQTEVPDYEKIGKDLPVFCISSRGYQQMRGRMKKDQRVVGFTTLEETEVPGLRNHTLDLAAAIQACHFRHHISEVCRMLGALDLFVAGDTANLKLSDKEKEAETKNLETALAKLGKALGEVVSRCIAECKTTIRTKILKRTGKAVSNAIEKALPTAEGWGAKYDEGGLRYMTYRATCRRGGIFKGRAGLKDFNEDLLKPLKSATAHSWDLAFNNRLPMKLATLASSSKQLMDSFHERMKYRRFLMENNNLVNEILVKLLAIQKENMAHIGQKHRKLVQDAQKDANRLFYPTIQGSMQKAYDDCMEQQGNGAFVIMKQLMKDHVEHTQNKMFKDAANKVEDAINDMLKTLEKTIQDDMNALVNGIEEDYVGIIGEIATEADNRARKVLGPALHEFYQKLVITLAPAEEERELTPDAIDVEDAMDTDDGSWHESD